MQIKTYTANPVVVQAIQITEQNMAEVAAWCKGEVRSEIVPTEEVQGEVRTRRYIKPKMYRAQQMKKNKGYAGDWVLKQGTNFKVYSDTAFVNGYTDGEALPIVGEVSMDVHPSIFNKMVEALNSTQVTHLAVPGHESTFTTPPAGVPMRGNGSLFVEQVPTGFEKPGQ